jgi:hypothetical protein
VAQVPEHLPNKHEVLSSNPGIPYENKETIKKVILRLLAASSQENTGGYLKKTFSFKIK